MPYLKLGLSKIYIPAVFLGAPNFGSIDLVGLPGSLRLGRILRVGDTEPGLLFFIRRPMGGDNEDVFFEGHPYITLAHFRAFYNTQRYYEKRGEKVIKS